MPPSRPNGQTLARDYETIYQSVAQAFYNVLQFEGDLVIQHDLIVGRPARRGWTI